MENILNFEMDVDRENILKSTYPLIKYSSVKLNQAELRIQNDLFDLKKNRLSVKTFSTQLSDVIKDEENEIFVMNVLINDYESKSLHNPNRVNMSSHVILYLMFF